MKFLICIDNNINSARGFEYEELNSTNVYDAINEAENYIDDNVYMVYLLEKTGKITKGYQNEKVTRFNTVLANRKNGWHRTDSKHSETQFIIEKHECGRVNWYEFIH